MARDTSSEAYEAKESMATEPKYESKYRTFELVTNQ
jgi:hypothetical protein